MKVNIGVLKNELSQYLHRVREGEEITITDRNEPIAKIIPLERTLVRVDMKKWLKDHPPVKTSKKQPSSAELLRQIRDEE
jgi:prevent-host-death family protein